MRAFLSATCRPQPHYDITVIDHSLTRSWTVNKLNRRDLNPRRAWVEGDYSEPNACVQIGRQSYYLSGDRERMPAKKDQSPPDVPCFGDQAAHTHQRPSAIGKLIALDGWIEECPIHRHPTKGG